jgi:hypothetical protein
VGARNPGDAGHCPSSAEPRGARRDLNPRVLPRRSQMTALTQSIARAFPANSLQINIVRQLLLLALAAVVVMLLRATYGLDLSWAFF